MAPKGVYMLRTIAGSREWWVPFPDVESANRMARGVEGAQVIFVHWGQDCREAWQAERASQGVDMGAVVASIQVLNHARSRALDKMFPEPEMRGGDSGD